MKNLSLDALFIGEAPGVEGGRRMPSARSLGAMEFNTAYDTLRRVTRERVERDDLEGAIKAIEDGLGDQEAFAEDEPMDMQRAARMQILVALQILKADLSAARLTAARLLTAMAKAPKRKDEPFLELLAAALYDIAVLHAQRSEYRQAERELDKSLKIFERLAKTNPGRYGQAHIMAQNAATQIIRSHSKQVETLANSQAVTSEYLKEVNAGMEDATARLVESLAAEGRTLANMGRHREAIQYLTRALKYETKIAPVFDSRQLAMSIDLGEALLNVKNTRDKGIHLLNTMLHKATKLGAQDEHRRIVDILLNAKTGTVDILGFWHKMFPK